jgi:hypothetical protein
MKKLLFLFSIAMLFIVSANAQVTTPRYGIVAGDDNTGRVLTYNYVSVVEKVGFDSIVPAPHAWTTIYKVNVANDSIRFSSPSITRSYFGDNIEIVVTGASGKKVSFAGVTNYANSKWVLGTYSGTGLTTGSIVLGSKGKAVIKFVFDGAVWVEAGRITN